VFSAISKTRSRIFVISNFEYVNGKQLASVEDEFFVSSLKARRSANDPALVITGWTPAVTKQDRADLKRLLRQKTDAAGIRQGMAAINARIAESKGADERISSSCFAFSLQPDGHAWGELHGRVKEHLVVGCICGGEDMTPIAEKVFREQYPGKVPVSTGITITGQPEAAGVLMVLHPEDT
jgi:hypothetical protein